MDFLIAQYNKIRFHITSQSKKQQFMYVAIAITFLIVPILYFSTRGIDRYQYYTNCQSVSQRRGHLAPQFFPFPPFKMVLGETHNSCEYLDNQCDKFTRGHLEWPEWFVRNSVASLLTKCLYQKCNVLDLGANLGYVSSYIASLGADLTSVEVQTDLYDAFVKTVAENCWTSQVTPLNAALTLNEDDDGKYITFTRGFWRVDDRTSSNKRNQKINVPQVSIGRLMRGKHFDFIKLDIDSFEIDFMARLATLVANKETSFDSIVLEVQPSTNPKSLGNSFCQFQSMGYHIFKFNQHEQRRWIDSKGIDVYSHWKPVYPSNYFYQERYSQRLMKYLLYIKPEPDCSKWEPIIMDSFLFRKNQVGSSFTNSYLVTKIEFLEPVVHEFLGKHAPSSFAKDYWEAQSPDFDLVT